MHLALTYVVITVVHTIVIGFLSMSLLSLFHISMVAITVIIVIHVDLVVIAGFACRVALLASLCPLTCSSCEGNPQHFWQG